MSLDLEIKKLVDQAVREAIAEHLGTPEREAQQMHGGLDFALAVLNENGKVIAKSTLYNKTMLGQVPCTRVGKRKLWFSRKELETWLKHGMPDVSKQNAEERISNHYK